MRLFSFASGLTSFASAKRFGINKLLRCKPRQHKSPAQKCSANGATVTSLGQRPRLPIQKRIRAESPTYQLLAGVLLALSTPCLPAAAAEYRVSSAAEIATATEKLQPGDVLVMANGTWVDQAIVIQAKGSETNPVTLRAETPGKVILTGKSSLTVGGEYLVVSGLWLKGGREAKDGVIIKGEHCRLTETAITDSTYKFYVHLSGHENRLDHCYLAGKTSESPTLQVEVEDQPNHHRIDNNHFGPRPPLGRNGGETIRIGYSHQSMKNSGTVVEKNLFERCDGELEIISNKSCENIYRSNTFSECAGMFTLRHGNRCLVEGNIVLGNHKKGSGGIRVIGEDHTVINNYIDGVENGGIWITSGIPDSPLNGYFQAKNCLIAFNTIIDCRGPAIELDAGFGSSNRSLRPEGITIANNLFSMRSGEKLLKGREGDGFRWIGNITATGDDLQSDQPGIRTVAPKLEQGPDRLWRPSVASPVRAAAEGEFHSIKADLDGQPRSERSDVGCDQLSNAPVLHHPLSASEVAPSWMKNAEHDSHS